MFDSHLLLNPKKFYIYSDLIRMICNLYYNISGIVNSFNFKLSCKKCYLVIFDDILFQIKTNLVSSLYSFKGSTHIPNNLDSSKSILFVHIPNNLCLKLICTMYYLVNI